MRELRSMVWPLSDAPQAIEVLAGRSQLTVRDEECPPVPPEAHDATRIERWLDSVAGALGVELEPALLPYGEMHDNLRRCGPALVRIALEGRPCLVAVVGPTMQSRIRVLGPDSREHKMPAQWLCDALVADVEQSAMGPIHAMLHYVRIPERRRRAVQRALLQRKLAGTEVGPVFLVRPGVGSGIWQQLRHARIRRFFVGSLGSHAVQYGLLLLSWWMIGRGALQGSIDRGWLWAWALVLLTIVPVRMLASWCQGRFSVGLNAVLKQRMLAGALQLDTEVIRREGSGQLLGRVLESGAVGTLAISGGFLAILSGTELLAVMGVLAMGAGGMIHVLLLGLWIAVTTALGYRYLQWIRELTDMRIEMTNRLVERLVGHRTRIVQERRESWHDDEDQELERYLRRVEATDRTTLALGRVVPRGWLVLGLVGLAPALVGQGTGMIPVAIAVGGILLGSRALGTFSQGITGLARAATAWARSAPLLQPSRSLQAAMVPMDTSTTGFLLEANDLTFRYRQHGEPILHKCGLRLERGQRLFLEGPSGAGKSTLAALLTGLRVPDSGSLLLRGLDRPTLGLQGWRRHVVAVPQFHENHVLTGTFAFNLLMGRTWPPSQADLRQAVRLCHELGLGELLDRMPSGTAQMLGENGWQLSHGERSRLYIARGLLQRPDLIVLDESFAALDPDNVQRAMNCVLRHTPAVLVIAHP